MRFKSQSFDHADQDKIGVLITNLGTPDAPNKSALRRYLKQFLSDPRVVEIPRLVWMLILHGIILNVRPARSAEAYASVWSDEGSPLLVHTKNQAEALQKRLAKIDHVVVEMAMRYGQPSIPQALDKLLDGGVRKLLVLPLYPQYSGSTTASTFDALADDFTKRRWLPELRFVTHYHDHPQYIAAVANKIAAHWQEHGRADKLVFSFHGVPKSYLENGDPYHCECHKTARLVAEYLNLSEQEYIVVFQSRFGYAEWLQPYCDETMKTLPTEGVKSVQVVCPGFAADCLETIEEIDVENREYFLAAGGERFEYIPALNSDDAHIDMLQQLIEENMLGWQVAVDETRAERAKNFP
ncbi:MAG: ferrochelatase [Pseudomonadales bacterium]